MIVWGSRFYGKVDAVPGLFYIVTRFGHLWFIPLIPMGTYLILDEEGEERGLEISFSFKSMLLGWLRGACVMATLFLFIIAFVANTDGDTMYSIILAVLTIFPIGLFTLTKMPFVQQADYDRARQLAIEAGFEPEAIDYIDSVYGRNPSRGGGDSGPRFGEH